MSQVYWPLRSGRMVTSPFGPRPGEFHTGVDFGFPGGSAGEPVYAIQSGTVIHAGAAQGYGGDPTGLAGWLVIDSSDDQGGGCLEYGHIVRLANIGIGTKVTAGQQIAIVNPNGGRGGTNGGVAPHLHVSDMPREYDQHAKQDPMPRLRNALEPPATKEKTMEKVLDYSRKTVAQETGHWCGPAMTENLLSIRGVKVPEAELARQIEKLENGDRGDDFDGTDHIGLAVQVLNKYLPEAGYVVVEMPNDPPTPAQIEKLWQHICQSVDAGYGVGLNIVSPPWNRFRPAKDSIPFAYPPGVEIKHYVMAAGKDESDSVRPVWIGDSGFYPFGGWVTLASLASLVPPKAYAYPAGAIAKAQAAKPPAVVAPPVKPNPAPPEPVPAPVPDRIDLEWLAFLGDHDALVEVLHLVEAGDHRAILVANLIEAVNPAALERI